MSNSPMTVEDMIAELQKLDPKLPVVYATSHGELFIKSVQVDTVYCGLHEDKETAVVMILPGSSVAVS